jgi:hypothetical protein
MKETAEQSADLKQALKKQIETPELAAEAAAYPLEAEEALSEVKLRLDTAIPGSWVMNAWNRELGLTP